MVRDAKVGEGSNKVVYWSRPFGWKNQTLTPNPDTIYLMPFINTKDVGPMVLEIPPADQGTIVGSVDDCWQAALEDVGPAGVDKGKGGKYLILPPGYKEKVPDGYIAMPSETYQTYALLRSNVKSKSDADIAAAVAYGKQIKLYPLAQAASPPATTFIDAIDVVYDANIPYDLRFRINFNHRTHGMKINGNRNNPQHLGRSRDDPRRSMFLVSEETAAADDLGNLRRYHLVPAFVRTGDALEHVA
jgi:hypothetical protein